MSTDNAHFPQPVPGLVIRYSYLWHREQREGREEGLKDRPAAIVAAITSQAGETRVMVLPITHTSPEAGTVAVELPRLIKKHLGLDDERSWVVVSEFNDFVWPGPDLRPVPDDPEGFIAYGMLPGPFFEAIRRAWLDLVSAGRSGTVRRTE